MQWTVLRTDHLYNVNHLHSKINAHHEIVAQIMQRKWEGQNFRSLPFVPASSGSSHIAFPTKLRPPREIEVTEATLVTPTHRSRFKMQPCRATARHNRSMDLLIRNIDNARVRLIKSDKNKPVPLQYFHQLQQNTKVPAPHQGLE